MTVNMKPLLSSRVLDLRIALADDSAIFIQWSSDSGVSMYFGSRKKIPGILAGRGLVA